MTTNEKIRAIAKGAEVIPAYFPQAAVSPMTMALWLLGIPPGSASTRRFRRRSRNELRATFATCAIPQATIGARRNFMLGAVGSRRGRSDPAEDAVHEASRLLAGEGLRQLDRLVDRRLGRHLALDVQLVDRDAKDDAVHLSHLLQLPVLGSLAQSGVEAVLVGQDSVHQLAGKLSDLGRRRPLGRVIGQHLVRVVVRA